MEELTATHEAEPEILAIVDFSYCVARIRSPLSELWEITVSADDVSAEDRRLAFGMLPEGVDYVTIEDVTDCILGCPGIMYQFWRNPAIPT